MTTLVERRGDLDVIALFLVAALGFAAWRGAEGAPLVAALLGLIAIVVLVFWVAWRRKPSSILAIAPDEIFFGRLDQSGTVIVRGATGRLEIRRGFRSSGWFLVGLDGPEEVAISLIGFDPDKVRRTCEAHGWAVA